MTRVMVRVLRLLRRGYGAEDIAVMGAASAADVWAVVASLRSDGRLEKLYAIWREEWRVQCRARMHLHRSLALQSCHDNVTE